MKKTIAKLKINRETVRHLVDDELARVNGARPQHCPVDDSMCEASCSTNLATKCAGWQGAF